MISVVELLALMTLAVLSCMALAAWGWMLTDCLTREPRHRALWVVGFFMVPLPTTLAYGVARYMPRRRHQRQLATAALGPGRQLGVEASQDGWV